MPTETVGPQGRTSALDRLRFSDDQQTKHQSWREQFSEIETMRPDEEFVRRFHDWQDLADARDAPGLGLVLVFEGVAEKELRVSLWHAPYAPPTSLRQDARALTTHVVKDVLATQTEEQRFTATDRAFLDAFWSYCGVETEQLNCQLTLPLLGSELVLDYFAAAGRLFVMGGGTSLVVADQITLTPHDKPLDLSFSCLAREDRREYELQFFFDAGDRRISLDECQLVGEALVLARKTLYRVHNQRQQTHFSTWLKRLTSLPAVHVVPTELSLCLETLMRHCWPGGTWQLAPQLTIEKLLATPSPKLYLKTLPSAAATNIDGFISYGYGKREFQSLLFADDAAIHHDFLVGVRQDSSLGPDQSQTTSLHVLERDFAAERQIERQFFAMQDSSCRYSRSGLLVLSADRLQKDIYTLLADGWEVWAENLKLRVVDDFHIQAQSGMDWFSLELKIGGQTILSPWQLIHMLKRKALFVRLDEGTVGILPEAWFDHLRKLCGLAYGDGDNAEAARLPLALLGLLNDVDDNLEDELSGRLLCDERLRKLRHYLKGLAGISPQLPGPDFRGELRPYQQLGLGWLRFLEDARIGGCLADDMGLGKTVQVLAWLSELHQRQQEIANDESLPFGRCCLIVATKSILRQWREEAERFCPHLSVMTFDELSGQSLREVAHNCDILIMNYHRLVSQANELSQVPWLAVVLDEAQNIKNAHTQRFHAAKKLRSHFRLALAGTPIENHIMELANIFSFLNPGMISGDILSRLADDAFITPVKEETKSTDHKTGSPAAQRLNALLRPFILRRTKDQVLPELPPKHIKLVKLDFAAAQAGVYQSVYKAARTALEQRIKSNGESPSSLISRESLDVFLEALLRLRQVCCHPGLIDPELREQQEASPKIDYLLQRAHELVENGYRALVFSQFTEFLKLLTPHLDEHKINYVYLDGQTQDRHEVISRFQSDKRITLFLISLRAGGAGLNLTAADHCFMMDPWWNVAVENQAIDRVHRIGQKRRVFVERLVIAGSIEEKMLALQEHKQHQANQIIASDHEFLRNLTYQDFHEIIEYAD